MFPAPFPGHLVQNEHHGHFDSPHNALRLKDLGSLSLRVRLGFSERVQTLLLRCFIRCKQTVRQHIILEEFGAQPFRLEVIFKLVSLLHSLRGLADTRKGRDRYPYLAYCSSMHIARMQTGRPKCWYTSVTEILKVLGIQIDCLPPFQYSLNAPGHLLPN